MAISLVAQAETGGSGAGTNISITHGFTLLENDVIVCLLVGSGETSTFSDDAAAPTFTSASGGTEQSTSGGAAYEAFYWVCDGTSPSTFDFDINASTLWSIQAIQLRGVNTASVWDVAPSASNFTDHGATSGTLNSSNITTSYDNSYAIAWWSEDSSDADEFSSYSLSYGDELETGGTPHRNQESVKLLLGSAGVQTGPSATHAGTQIAMSWHFALRAHPTITSVSSDDTVGAAENPWNITGTGFGAD